MELRDYQHDGIQQIRAAYARGRRAPLYVAPTGAGKTVLFAFIAAAAQARGTRVVILVHRAELLEQTSNALSMVGVAHGVIAPGQPRVTASVQVASVMTLARRLNQWRDAFDLIIIDECHHAIAQSWKTVIDAYPRARLLGVTATPERLDGRGLKHIFDDLIIGPTVRELIDWRGTGGERALVDARVWSVPTADFSSVSMRAGDYALDELAAITDQRVITGSAVEHYRRYAPDMRAIAFCVNIAHAEHVCAQFREAGIASAVIDGTISASDRRRIIADFRDGAIRVLTSCNIVSEGFDLPAVGCGILLRKTASTALYLQQVGRCLRAAPGKEHAIILDHVGNVLMHGLPSADREWSLDGQRRNRTSRAMPSLVHCQQCFAVYASGSRCPQCGSTRDSTGIPSLPDEKPGQLTEVIPQTISPIDRKRLMRGAHTLAELEHVAQLLGYKKGWAYYVWKHRQKRGSNQCQRERA